LHGVNTGALKSYHSDISHSIPTTTLGAGGKYFINDNLYVSFGVSNTFYHDLSNSGVNYGSIIANETYDRTALDIAIGVGFSR
jgi:hypothetical protein